MTVEELIDEIATHQVAVIGIASTANVVHFICERTLLLKEAVRQGLHEDEQILSEAVSIYESLGVEGYAHPDQDILCIFMWLLSKRLPGAYASRAAVDAELFLERLRTENRCEWRPYVPDYAAYLLKQDEPAEAPFEDPFESDTEPDVDAATVETETKAEPFEEVCELPNSGHLYRQKNAAGGYTYWSDEVGGGVLVYDTCMVGEDTLLCAITEEMRRRHWEAVAKRQGVTVEQLKERVRRQNAE